MDLCTDSRLCRPGCLFFCLRGATVDGHAFAAAAYAAGCRLFCAEHSLDLPPDALVTIVPDTTEALAAAADIFYGHPSQKLRVIAVTGTKGKTTTAVMAQHVLCANGIPCGYIGTCGIRYNDVFTETANTTPDSLTLQKTMRDMVDAGISVLCLEVSSQAVKMKRVARCVFSAAVMTNFSPDHIGPGEHASLAEYLACKTAVLTDYGAQLLIINADDATTVHAAERALTPKVTYGTSGTADYSAAVVNRQPTDNGPGITFTCRHGGQTLPCRLPLPGDVNVSNALAALAIADFCGVPTDKAAQALETVVIPGRFETYAANGITVVIDYAHNGASLSAALAALRPYCRGRLIAVFGSVGERTQIRRTELGIAAQGADFCVLTADNPGKEDPLAITAEIAKAIGESVPVLQIADRAEAIKTAIAQACPGDVILLAGKGHETYQFIGRTKEPFCEKEIVKNALRMR